MEDDSLLARFKATSENFHLVTIEWVSKTYGISIRTLRRMQAAGKMPPQHKHGRPKKYERAEIEALFEERLRKQK